MGRARGRGQASAVGARRGVADTETGLSTPDLAWALGVQPYNGEHAAVDEAVVSRIAARLRRSDAGAKYVPAKWDNQMFWNAEGSDAERAQYFTIGNAINFRFWELQEGEVVRGAGVIGGERYAGAMYMWRALRVSLDDGRVPLLDADFLANISEEEFDLIFTDDDGNNPLAVARAERIANIRDLGEQLQKQWGGQALNLARAAEGSLIEFARLAQEIRAFDDPVFKLSMLNAIMLGGSGINEWEDAPLPAIDYHLIRHAVRQGMVLPSAEIAAKLAAGSLLDEDEAKGLRAATLDAYLQLCEKTNMSGEVIDNQFWFNRNNCSENPVCLDPQTAAQCPFLDVCDLHVEYGLPLELTRYY
jgi:hypothetical protein